MKQYIFYQVLNIGLDINTSEEIYLFLSKNKYIARDYNTGNIVCLIGLYEGEDGIELNTSILDEVTSRIEEYRKLFKVFKRPGIMGNRQECIEKLSRFCATHNKTFDECLTITQWYIQHTEFPANADNFIFHIDSVSGKEKSRMEVCFDEYVPELDQKFI